MKTQLFTVGYSGHDLDSFLSVLRAHGIETVIDVRRRPLSRKRGFSKAGLAASLQTAGIEYVHLRELGVPDDLRAQLKHGACDLDEYLKVFEKYLDGCAPSLREVYDLSLTRRCCLLCVEVCAAECHRSVVATAVTAVNGRKIEVVDLCQTNGSNGKC